MFKKLFLKSIPPARPVLLIVGHKTHVTTDVIETAAANKVLIFCIPAHSSHLVHPLDLSLFGPLKRGAAFNHFTSLVVHQHNFTKVFIVVWNSSNTPDVIRGGFRHSGTYPSDPSVFDFSKLTTTIPYVPATSLAPGTMPSHQSAPPATMTPTTAPATMAYHQSVLPPTVASTPPATGTTASHQSAPIMARFPQPCLFSDPLLSSAVADPPFQSLSVDHPGVTLKTLVTLLIDLGKKGRDTGARNDMILNFGGRNSLCPCKTACS